MHVFVSASCEKNSRQSGSQVHCLAAKAFWGVSWDEGSEYLTTSEIRPTAVLRSDRSMNSVEHGIGVGEAGGCHWLRDSSVCCRDESWVARAVSSAWRSLAGFASDRMVVASLLSRRWPIWMCW